MDGLGIPPIDPTAAQPQQALPAEPVNSVYLTEHAAELAQRDPEVADLLTACANSTKVFARTFFPERFYAEFSPLHDEIFSVIDSAHPRNVIASPRGIGKTSIVGLAYAARNILFRLKRFIVYVSTSFEVAQLQTENLKMELMTNKMIKYFFGSLKMKAADSEEGLEEAFTKKAWVAMGHTLVLPRGSGQQIRGLLYRNNRPDLFIVDDLEDPETIENEEIRKRRKQWFFADLMKAVSRVDKGWKIVYIDTLKHEDALLEHLLNDPTWLAVRQELCDDDLRSNAPTFVSDEQIRAEYEAHKEQGMLDVFAREYRNQPISREDAVFRQEYFRYYSEQDLAQKGGRIENVILVDPAKTIKSTSAETAIIVVGLDYQSRAIYVRDIVAGRLHPDQVYEQIFLSAERFNCRVLGVEVTSLNEFITQPLKQAMSLRGLFLELIELKPRGGASKEQRIKALEPYYRQGLIFHNPSCCHKLEQQLLSFPRSRLLDVADCLAYVVEMMDIGDRMFEPEDEGDEFEALLDLETQDDPPLEGWRLME